MHDRTDTDFIRIASDGSRRAEARPVAEEVPIAVEFNGIGYSVLMATPTDLVDLAYGFALSERLIDDPRDIVDVDHHSLSQGIVLRITLIDERARRIVDRVRHRVSESSCGLCGIENLEQAMRPVPRVRSRSAASHGAIFAALDALRANQPLNAMTGAVHAAALCDQAGAIRLTREDVGRHNAFDKLIGAKLRAGEDWDGGFALLTSRCSYELVEKAALADCPLLVAVSAPTGLAISRAREAGLALVVLARSDSMLALS